MEARKTLYIRDPYGAALYSREVRFGVMYLVAVTLLMLAFDWQDWLLAADLADKEAMVVLNFTGSAYADSFWYIISQKITWFPLAAAVLVAIAVDSDGTFRRKLALLGLTVLVIVLADQISSGLIKPLVGRLRPSHDPAICGMLHYVNGYHGGRFGFVSSHAANSAAAAMWVCLLFRSRLAKASAVTFAALTCYSRIYLGVHYLGDVLCGAALGCGIALLVYRSAQNIINMRHGRVPGRVVTLVFGLTMATVAVASAV